MADTWDSATLADALQAAQYTGERLPVPGERNPIADYAEKLAKAGTITAPLAARIVSWATTHKERGCWDRLERPGIDCRCQCPDHGCITIEYDADEPVQCQACGDARYVVDRLRFVRGVPVGGRAIRCPECNVMDTPDIDRLVEVSGIRGWERTYRLPDLDSATGSPRDFYHHWGLSGWRRYPLATVHGPPGTGKSHGAIAVALDWIRTGRLAFAITAARLLDRLRDTFDGDSALSLAAAERLPLSCALLILDDYGASKGTEWAEERLLSLIEDRRLEGKATIVTSNLTADEMRARNPRLASRMLGDDRAVNFRTLGPDRRVKDPP